MKAKEAIKILNEICEKYAITYTETLAVKYATDAINRLCTIAEIHEITKVLREIEESIE
jgi:hypothetical protein